MDGKEIIASIREAIAELKAKGQKTVQIENLENYCATVEKELTQSLDTLKMKHANELEHYKAKNTAELENFKAQTLIDIEMFKAVIASGLDALRAAILINGGAVVVLLGFLSSVISRGNNELLGLGLTHTLLCFGSGVFLSAVGLAFRYFSQDAYGGHQNNRNNPNYDGKLMRIGNYLKIAAITAGLLSFLAFTSGATLAYFTLSEHFEFAVSAILKN